MELEGHRQDFLELVDCIKTAVPPPRSGWPRNLCSCYGRSSPPTPPSSPPGTLVRRLAAQLHPGSPADRLSRSTWHGGPFSQPLVLLYHPFCGSHTAGTFSRRPSPCGGQRPSDAPHSVPLLSGDSPSFLQLGSPTVLCSPPTTTRGPSSSPYPCPSDSGRPSPSSSVHVHPSPPWRDTTGPQPIRPLPGGTMGRLCP